MLILKLNLRTIHLPQRNIKLTDNGIMITKDYLKELGINLYQNFKPLFP